MTVESIETLAQVEQFAGDPAATALLFDIDGTLADITEDPAETVIEPEVVEALRRLSERFAFLGLVTGRDLERSRSMLGTREFPVAAVHGMHIDFSDGNEWIDPAAATARPQLDIAVQMARTVGWRFEDKRASVALHFRHVNDPERTAQQMRSQILTVLDPRLVTLHDAKQAVEVRPVGGATKGDAVERFVEHAGSAVRRVVYVGDDMTDLDAFQRLDTLGLETLKVAVGTDETPEAITSAADVVLAGVPDVHTLLQRLGA